MFLRCLRIPPSLLVGLTILTRCLLIFLLIFAGIMVMICLSSCRLWLLMIMMLSRRPPPSLRISTRSIIPLLNRSLKRTVQLLRRLLLKLLKKVRRLIMRRKMSKAKSRRMFKKGAMKILRQNTAPAPMRGGIRM